MKKTIISILITLIIGFILYYLLLPAINLTYTAIWVFTIFLVIIFTTTYFILEPVDIIRKIKLPAIIMCVLIVLLILGTVITAPIFNAKRLQKRLPVEETTFEQVMENVNWNSVPQIDKDSAMQLGSRKMGTLTEEVSQYDVSNYYTLINYKGVPYRVSPLQYSSLIKYFTNKKNGIPGYIAVNLVTKEAEFVRLDEGIHYSPFELFGKNLKRHLRFNYPTAIFGTESFEINEDGLPFWVVPKIKYTIGIGGGSTVEGIFTVNAINGEISYYKLEEVPSWIDRAMDTNVVENQIDSWGKFADGYWNSIFGQKNVKEATRGYNYITMRDDVYYYTGITSVVSDESNLGFMLVNMRTGNAYYFALSSAEEFSAMSSAEGAVQNLRYTATFPILLNINNIPTYFISLKDNAGLVKKYAFVSVENYQQVTTIDANYDNAINDGVAEYLKMMGTSNENQSNTENNIEEEITIEKITSAQIDGNSVYYIQAKGKLYIANISVAKNILPILEVGEKITVKGYLVDNICNVTNVTK